MTDTVIATNGVELPLIALEQTFAYTGSFLTSITVSYADGNSPSSVIDYVQTFTNDGTNITGASQWVAAS